jgi:hypothetical protein
MRPGCEFDGEVAPNSNEITNLLPTWLENAAISGYGDMRALKTKVDPAVRDAKEILASEFTVDPSFLEKIRETWSRNFIPKNVRVEPYKVHLYGPNGHFESIPLRMALSAPFLWTWATALGNGARVTSALEQRSSVPIHVVGLRFTPMFHMQSQKFIMVIELSSPSRSSTSVARWMQNKRRPHVIAQR